MELHASKIIKAKIWKLTKHERLMHLVWMERSTSWFVWFEWIEVNVENNVEKMLDLVDWVMFSSWNKLRSYFKCNEIRRGKLSAHT